MRDERLLKWAKLRNRWYIAGHTLTFEIVGHRRRWPVCVLVTLASLIVTFCPVITNHTVMIVWSHLLFDTCWSSARVLLN